jgi:hypothetical protein
MTLLQGLDGAFIHRCAWAALISAMRSVRHSESGSGVASVTWVAWGRSWFIH